MDYHTYSEAFVESLLTVCRQKNVWGFSTFNGESGLPSVDVVCYKPGDFYKSHTDWGNRYQNRKISFTIQLTDPDQYDGGDVWLYDGPEAWHVSKAQGSMTLWPSWTLHSVDPVLQGERWSVVGWVLGPPFI